MIGKKDTVTLNDPGIRIKFTYLGKQCDLTARGFISLIFSAGEQLIFTGGQNYLNCTPL